MKVTYETRATATCPLNEFFVDHYDVVIVSDQLVTAERILQTISDVTVAPIFQEDLTVELAHALEATVTTVGYHSGVKTTATA